MLKVITAASILFAGIRCGQIVPERPDMTPGSVPERLLKGDRLPVCNKGPAWRYYDAACIRECTPPVERPRQNREIRIVAVDRVPTKLSVTTVAN